MNELRSIIDDALRRLSPKSNMAKTLSYGRKRWEGRRNKALPTRHARRQRLKGFFVQNLRPIVTP